MTSNFFTIACMLLLPCFFMAFGKSAQAAPPPAGEKR